MNKIRCNLNERFSKIIQMFFSLFIFITLINFLKIIEWNYFITFSYVPSAKEVLKEFVENLSNISFYKNTLISIYRVYIGFGLATVLAIPLGILINESRIFKSCVYPILEIIRPIPNVAWVPLSIVLFKTIDGSVLFITFIGAFFPILINTIEGLDNINENYLKIAKSFNVKKKVYITEVKLPAAASNIYTGLLIGMSGSWLGVVVAEMISGQSGLGYLTWVNYTLVNMQGVVMCMFFIGGLGALSSCLIRKLYKVMHF